MDFTKVLPLNGHKPYLHSVTDSRHAPAPPDTAKKKVKRPLEKITRKTSGRKYRKGGCSQPLTTNSAYPIQLIQSAYPIQSKGTKGTIGQRWGHPKQDFN